MLSSLYRCENCEAPTSGHRARDDSESVPRLARREKPHDRRATGSPVVSAAVSSPRPASVLAFGTSSERCSGRCCEGRLSRLLLFGPGDAGSARGALQPSLDLLGT